MLTWPHADTDWSDHLKQVESLYIEISRHICRFQRLLAVCHSDAHLKQVDRLLTSAGLDSRQVRLAVAPSNDTWARDHAPLTVLTEAGPRLIDFQFNGWGGKYAAELDNQISPTLFRNQIFGDTEHRSIPLVLEGGAVETDGQGTLMATRSSVLSGSRNPRLDQSAVEQQLQEALGIKRFLWLQHGHLTGDDTDGHIDTLARFADPGTILYATARADDPDAEELQHMAEELNAFTQADGSAYQLIPLPPIPPLYSDTGERMPAGYANFLIINGAVLLPVYGIEEDEEAVRVLQMAFPGREIVPINCLPLVRQNGSLHCITMQFPEGVIA